MYLGIDKALTTLAEFQRNYGSAELMGYGLLEIRTDGKLGESWGDEALLAKVNEFALHSHKVSRTA